MCHSNACFDCCEMNVDTHTLIPRECKNQFFSRSHTEYWSISCHTIFWFLMLFSDGHQYHNLITITYFWSPAIEYSAIMDTAPLGNLTAAQKDQLMTEVKQQMAVANAQELLTVCALAISRSRIQLFICSSTKCFIQFVSHHLQKITEKCFKKCVGKPGTSLGNSEQVNIRHTHDTHRPIFIR